MNEYTLMNRARSYSAAIHDGITDISGSRLQRAPDSLGGLVHQSPGTPSGVSDSGGQTGAREPACLTTGAADAAGSDGTLIITDL